MKPILYCHTSRVGGAEIASPALAEHIGAEIWSRGGGPTVDRAAELGVPVTVLPVAADSRPKSLVARLATATSLLTSQVDVLRQIRRSRPPLLISNTVQGLLHVAVPALVTRTPLVVYVRDLGRGGNRPPLEVWVYESLMRLWSSGVIFNSETTRRSWRVSAPSIVVPTAIEDRFFTASAPARHGGIVMVGRIARWKGQAEVIRALNHLADGGRSVELTLVGDRTFGDNVDLPPARFPLTLKGFADPLEYLTHRQLLVHASKTPEPFGQVLAQAAAAGIPIICANRGGQTEWLKHGESCLMSDPHDTDALAAAIEQTLDDPARSAQRADVANAASEQFRAEKAYGPLQDWLKKVANL